MHNQLASFSLLKYSLEKHIPVRLMYVLESEGSSPGRQGFCMAVNVCGQMKGSLGGGIMEHKFVEMAKQQLQENKPASDLINQIHNKTAGHNQSGMICNGEQTIFLYDVKPGDLAMVNALLKSLEANENGTLQISNNSIRFFNAVPDVDYSYKLLSETEFEYTEKTGYKNQLYIIGGGHCSLALSKLMRDMDYYITVFDNRKDLYTLQQNNFAHQKIILDNYSDLKNYNFAQRNSFAIIMTFGYRTDKEVAEAWEGKSFNYLGMLGSSNKIRELHQQFKAQGMESKWLEEIDAPAGISIKSKTPEEIAISIAAKIIEIKNRD